MSQHQPELQQQEPQPTVRLSVGKCFTSFFPKVYSNQVFQADLESLLLQEVEEMSAGQKNHFILGFLRPLLESDVFTHQRQQMLEMLVKVQKHWKEMDRKILVVRKKKPVFELGKLQITPEAETLAQDWYQRSIIFGVENILWLPNMVLLLEDNFYFAKKKLIMAVIGCN